MAQVVRDLFKAPARLARTMGKIVPQIMERDIVDEIPFLFGGLVLKSLKPEMNAVLRQSPPVVLPFGDGKLCPVPVIINTATRRGIGSNEQQTEELYTRVQTQSGAGKHAA